MNKKMNDAGSTFQELVDIMHRLRAPGGCPWDREQTFDSLRTYIIEESYELVDAITSKDIGEIIEESGDLLLQPVFIATIAEEKGLFHLSDILEVLRDKLIRRHPHVFADINVQNSQDVLKNWERIKTVEKKNNSRGKDHSVLSGVPINLPALVKAYRTQEKAANVGFDWPKGDRRPLFDKIEEEIGELKEALYNETPSAVEDEMGDLFFALVNLARHLDIEPEVALQKACMKFNTRFRAVEEKVHSSGKAWDGHTLAELEELWECSKKEIREQRSSDCKGGMD